MNPLSESDFYAVFDRYHDRIKRFVLVTVKDEWVADDLTQETFIRAQKKIDSLEEPEKISSWLFRIAYRLCLDHFRNTNRQHQKEIAVDDRLFPSYPHSAEKKLQQHQMSVCVQNQILRLSESHRTVLWLFDELGFTLKETAGILDITVDNVKIRLHRARNQLKAILNRNCSFEKDERDVLVCEPKGMVNPPGTETDDVES